MNGEPLKLYDDLCEGVPIPSGFPAEEFKEAMKYKPRPGELFIVAYPRSGTTWMQYIVLQILRRGKLSDDPMDFYVSCPYLEMTGSEAAEYLAAAGVARSHLPYHKMPMSKDAKYIYVCRNPGDCVVSFYKQMNESSVGSEDRKFDEFFESFMAGEVPYGDYFDHVAGWYEHRNDPNVYIVTYENLKKDTAGEIYKLAKFIGDAHERALSGDSKVMEDVLRHSSFEFMQKYINDIMTKFKKGAEVTSLNKENKLPPGFRKLHEGIREYGCIDEFESNFIRKGEVGDWKNYLMPEHLKRINEKIALRSGSFGFTSLWGKDYFTSYSCE